MPSHAERLAHLRQRHLQLLEGADQALAPGRSAADSPAHRLGDLPRVERVVDPPVPGQVPRAAPAGPVRPGSQVISAEPDAGQLRGGVHEPGVASSRYGATKAATTMTRRYARRGHGATPPCGMNVVFVEPAFPPTQRQFVRALAEVGATVIGIGESPGDCAGRRAAGLDVALPPGADRHRRRRA